MCKIINIVVGIPNNSLMNVNPPLVNIDSSILISVKSLSTMYYEYWVFLNFLTTICAIYVQSFSFIYSLKKTIYVKTVPYLELEFHYYCKNLKIFFVTTILHTLCFPSKCYIGMLFLLYMYLWDSVYETKIMCIHVCVLYLYVHV